MLRWGIRHPFPDKPGHYDLATQAAQGTDARFAWEHKWQTYARFTGVLDSIWPGDDYRSMTQAKSALSWMERTFRRKPSVARGVYFEGGQRSGYNADDFLQHLLWMADSLWYRNGQLRRDVLHDNGAPIVACYGGSNDNYPALWAALADGRDAYQQVTGRKVTVLPPAFAGYASHPLASRFAYLCSHYAAQQRLTPIVERLPLTGGVFVPMAFWSPGYWRHDEAEAVLSEATAQECSDGLQAAARWGAGYCLVPLCELQEGPPVLPSKQLGTRYVDAMRSVI